MDLTSLENQIENLNTKQLIELNNTYCINRNYCDDEIFYNDSNFFETYLPNSKDMLEKIKFGRYNPNEKFVKFNGYGNLISFNEISINILPHSVWKVAEYVYENQNEFTEFNFDYSECIDEEND